MSKLKLSHHFEVCFWLALVAFFFAYSFEFNQNIEIYRYGATLWPRVILLLIALAAIGQYFDQKRRGNQAASNTMAAAHEEPDANPEHTGLRWYASTLLLLAIPFIYMTVPEKLAEMRGLEGPAAGQFKLICAAVLFAIYLLFTWRNKVGGILALPIFFAALLEDMGFYALAPVFIIGVMLLMGERRPSRIALITPLIYGLLLAFFVSLLYVGLPTGNVSPFYDFGNWVVTKLQ
jgi:hypothetical protein